MINNFFFILSILFICSDLYYLRNRPMLNLKFKERELESFSILDLCYYFSRVFYWIWVIIGLFSSFYTYFIVIISVSLSRFVIYHLSKRFYVIYDILVTLISIITLILLVIDKLTG